MKPRIDDITVDAKVGAAVLALGGARPWLLGIAAPERLARMRWPPLSAMLFDLGDAIQFVPRTRSVTDGALGFAALAARTAWGQVTRVASGPELR